MKIKIFSFLFILFFASHAFGEINVKEKERGLINGAQVFVIDGAYKKNMGLFFRQAKEKGVDTVFFRVFHNAGDRPHFGAPSSCSSGVYFKTDVLCTVNDLLAPAVKAAHENGIKFYAWMATRSLTGLKTKDNMSLAFVPGGTAQGYGANVFKTDVRNKLIRLFKDLAKYDIDGILFQDDFILKYTEGADIEAKTLFFNETGYNAKPELFFKEVREINGVKKYDGLTEDFYVWAEWKADYMARLFSELKESALSVNPHLSFAANIYYETPIFPDKGLAWYSQKIKNLLDAGADYLAVMGYYEQIGEEMNKNINDTAILIGSIARESSKMTYPEPFRVIMKLQTSSFNKPGQATPGALFRKVCASVRKTDGLSVTVVPIFSPSNIYSGCFKHEPKYKF